MHLESLNSISTKPKGQVFYSLLKSLAVPLFFCFYLLVSLSLFILFLMATQAAAENPLRDIQNKVKFLHSMNYNPFSLLPLASF